jgi:hypothetical protein
MSETPQLYHVIDSMTGGQRTIYYYYVTNTSSTRSYGESTGISSLSITLIILGLVVLVIFLVAVTIFWEEWRARVARKNQQTIDDSAPDTTSNTIEEPHSTPATKARRIFGKLFAARGPKQTDDDTQPPANKKQGILWRLFRLRKGGPPKLNAGPEWGAWDPSVDAQYAMPVEPQPTYSADGGHGGMLPSYDRCVIEMQQMEAEETHHQGNQGRQ